MSQRFSGVHVDTVLSANAMIKEALVPEFLPPLAFLKVALLIIAVRTGGCFYWRRKTPKTLRIRFSATRRVVLTLIPLEEE